MQCNKASISIEYNLNIPLDFFFLQQRKATYVKLLKDAISTRKQPSCKKGCSPMYAEWLHYIISKIQKSILLGFCHIQRRLLRCGIVSDCHVTCMVCIFNNNINYYQMFSSHC